MLRPVRANTISTIEAAWRLELTCKATQQTIDQYLTTYGKHDDLILFLYLQDDIPIGYGRLEKQDGKWHITGGLLPEHRNRGLGKELFAHLSKQKRVTYAQVQERDMQAYGLLVTVGFKERFRRDGIIYLWRCI